MLPFIEQQLYHTLVTFFNSYSGPVKQGFFLAVLQVSCLGRRDTN